MKIQIPQKDLLKHINIVQKAVSSRTTIQILEGILLEAKDNRLKLTGTDLDLSIETEVPCLVEEEGRMVIHSNIFGNIVRKLPDTFINISVLDQKINILCQNSEFNLIGYNPDDYPELPDKGDRISLTIPSDLFGQAIRQTVFATSIEESRPTLMGVLIEIKDGMINFVALDGYRLAIRRIPTESKDTISIIVPARALNDLIKIMTIGEDVKIQAIPGHVIFDLESSTVYSRLLEGNFIKYNDIISNERNTTLTVNRRDLLSSLERASLLAREEKANLVKFKIENNQIFLHSNTEIGTVNEMVYCHQTGSDLSIAFNAKYFSDGLKAIDSDEVELLFTGSLNPCLMHPVEEGVEYTYLVLPVRLVHEDM